MGDVENEITSVFRNVSVTVVPSNEWLAGDLCFATGEAEEEGPYLHFIEQERKGEGQPQIFKEFLRHSQLFRVGPASSLWVTNKNSPSCSIESFCQAISIQFPTEAANSAFVSTFSELKSDTTSARATGRELANGSCDASWNQSKFDKKIESSSAKMYFHYYGQLLHQQNMLQDYVRTGSYYAAVIENRIDFQGRIVVDVGAGSGILSLFAAQAGAKHVYAVEASDMVDYARKLIDGNPSLGQRITVIQGKVEEVELPEKADILISEPMGTLLVNERMLESYVIARDRFLSPVGKMFPTIGRIHMAPFSDEYLYVEIANKALFWQQQNYYGVDLTPLHGSAFQGYFSQPVVDAFDPRMLIAPAIYHTIDFTKVKEEELYEIDIPLNFTASIGTRVHGLACWFDVLFNGSAVQRWLTTAPGAPTTHWYQLRCVLSQPIYVMAGQTITGRLHMVAHSAQSYTMYLTMSAKMWGAGADQGGILQTSSSKLDLKEPYYRMSQPQAYAWAQDQSAQQLVQQQQLNKLDIEGLVRHPQD
ncbi:probable histone-arginine methyltransferase CARM1 isoform X2 [Cryptomeria japonica]|uniref:probable histone-arginine methyltransferase CARM1 isoform X2 n=1 Tax=Cryptomeria japonica TaxID=3369 RepID=UPI0025AD089E|nr:probable histone-arginine methyltransferase CARM1 isoform X2 [Cryptomeria japonica]